MPRKFRPAAKLTPEQAEIRKAEIARLKAKIEGYGLTQAAFALKLRTTPDCIQKWLSGYNHIPNYVWSLMQEMDRANMSVKSMIERYSRYHPDIDTEVLAVIFDTPVYRIDRICQDLVAEGKLS
jgi:DNA-binding transcriptional regulator YiaG